jgi:hypothetical protein
MKSLIATFADKFIAQAETRKQDGSSISVLSRQNHI